MDERERQKRARRGRLTFMLVLAVCIGPFVLAWTWYFMGQPGLGEDTTNYGDLVDPPVSLENTELDVLVDREEREQSPVLEEHRWVLLYVAGDACAAECREVLWGTRQIRLAMGRNMGRIQRVLIEPAGESEPDYYADQHSDLRVLDLGDRRAEAFIRQLALDDIPEPRDSGRLYLIDPLGNLIMTYPPGFDPNGLMDDLELLLRASQVG